MRMKYLFFAFTFLVTPLLARAQSIELQADSFANIYASTCLKHLSKLDVLRNQLRNLPRLPPEKAAGFLQGRPGSAWPVPDKHGTFVLAIPDGINMCAVYARRVNAPLAQQQFKRMVSIAPKPLMARIIEDRLSQSAKNGQTQTVSYEWATNGATRKIVFMLTTANAESADIQGLVTASVVQ